MNLRSKRSPEGYSDIAKSSAPKRIYQNDQVCKKNLHKLRRKKKKLFQLNFANSSCCGRKILCLCVSQRVHIRCRHTILAHLFFRVFSFPPLFSYSPRLSLSLSHSPLSLTHSLSLTVSPFLLPTHSPIYLSLSYSPHLSLSHSPFSLSASFPLSFFPFKTIQPMRRV